jgi:glutamate N-acetyltransferase/amino-acid N-acetyltransferase
MRPVAGGGVTTPEGFAAAGVACGLKSTFTHDLGVLVSLRRAASAIVDTTSALPSAAVLHTRTLDPVRLQGTVVNSGNANAATGSPGIEDARAMGARAAAGLGREPGEIAVASTGTIGDRLRMDLVEPGIDRVAAAADPGGGDDFAHAITTTDRWTKSGAWALALPSGAEVRLGVAAKGAGMIRPDMATMLCYLTTDAAVEAGALGAMTRAAAAGSFNRISVDGQMSPSDTLLVLANGQGTPLRGADAERLADGLLAVCRWAAVQMVKDGEGAQHVVRVLVEGALDDAEARAVARAVAESPLIRAAAFGRDPNWGRISQAVGQALAGRGGPAIGLEVAFDGVACDDPAVAGVMAREEYDLRVALGRGGGRAEVLASDLTYEYVRINAEYHT